MFLIWPVSARWICPYSPDFYCALIAQVYKFMFIATSIICGLLSGVIAGKSHYAAIQIPSEGRRDDVSVKTNITCAFCLCTPAYCTDTCTVKYSLSLSMTVRFSLPVFPIVGRQMAASVTRKGVFDHTEGWIHYEGYEQWWWWRKGGRLRGSKSLSDLPSVAQTDLKGSSGNDQSPG